MLPKSFGPIAIGDIHRSWARCYKTSHLHHAIEKVEQVRQFLRSNPNQIPVMNLDESFKVTEQSRRKLTMNGIHLDLGRGSSNLLPGNARSALSPPRRQGFPWFDY